MKIAIVHTSIDARRGGAETSVLEMAAALTELGQDITLVTSGKATPHQTLAMPIESLSTSGWSKARRLKAFIAAAARFCAKPRFDIVHSVVPMPGCDVYQPRGGTVRATMDANLLLSPSPLTRSLTSFGQRWNGKQQLLLRLEAEMLSGLNPPHVAAVSQWAVRHIAAVAPHFPPARLHAVLNGCDPNRIEARSTAATAAARSQLGIDSKRGTLLFVAHNFKLKGLRELLFAMAEPILDQVRPRLIIAGRGNPTPYRRLANSLNISDLMLFTGASAEMNRLFAAADALIHPTWYDPCSRVVLEALCHGIPVVTTCRNGAAEALSQGAGFVVSSPEHRAELASAIAEALSPAARNAALAAAAEKREQLSMKRHALELIDLYRRISLGTRR